MLTETLFPVKEVPAVGQLFGEGLKEKTGYKFIIREDTGEVLSCMTDEYKLVTNQEIIKTAEPILKGCGATLREAKVLQDGKKTQWKYVIL